MKKVERSDEMELRTAVSVSEHVPTQRGRKAAHRPSGRKLSSSSFPRSFPGVNSRCSGGIGLACGSALKSVIDNGKVIDVHQGVRKIFRLKNDILQGFKME